MHNSATHLMLDHRISLPLVGIGTWKMDEPTTVSALLSALEAGYRLIDTASYYENEGGVGKAVTKTVVPRDEIFVTSKVRGADQGFKSAKAAVDRSLELMNIDFIDMMLIHWPQPALGLYVETWDALIECQQAGKVRVIGVSNFEREHLSRLIQATGVRPAVNQIQCNPMIANQAMVDANADFGIATQAWEPLGVPQGALTEPSVLGVARRHHRTPAQVLLRWNLEHRRAVIPKSADPARQRENLAVTGWRLDADDLTALAKLDTGRLWRLDPTITDVP